MLKYLIQTKVQNCYSLSIIRRREEGKNLKSTIKIGKENCIYANFGYSDCNLKCIKHAIYKDLQKSFQKHG